MSVNIQLEPQEVNVVLAGLGEIQLKNSLDLWFKIKSQAEQQMAAQQQAAQQPAEPAQPGDDAATA